MFSPGCSLLCFPLPLARCPTLSIRHVLFGFDPNEIRIVPNVFVYMLNDCKYFIWHARNDFRFRDVQPGAIVIIEEVKSTCLFYSRDSSLLVAGVTLAVSAMPMGSLDPSLVFTK